MPLDNSGRLDQHHRVQTARPQSVEPDPEQTVDRKQPRPARPLAPQYVQLMTESEVLQFHDGSATESASNRRDDGTQMLRHAENTMAVDPKTLDFSPLSEFLVGTGLLCPSHSTPSSRGSLAGCGKRVFEPPLLEAIAQYGTLYEVVTTDYWSLKLVFPQPARPLATQNQLRPCRGRPFGSTTRLKSELIKESRLKTFVPRKSDKRLDRTNR